MGFVGPFLLRVLDVCSVVELLLCRALRADGAGVTGAGRFINCIQLCAMRSQDCLSASLIDLSESAWASAA